MIVPVNALACGYNNAGTDGAGVPHYLVTLIAATAGWRDCRPNAVMPLDALLCMCVCARGLYWWTCMFIQVRMAIELLK